ncbi:MAG: HAD family hydrolase [candidate division Zixibacteria bacterium]|nr:HAD family hydrolase [candidate division Zixibacteria bacterium]
MIERAIFFDRDGTITVEKEYNFNPDAVELITGALEALQLARAHNFRLFVVTNQSGVARGLGSEDDVRRVNRRLEELVAAGAVHFDGIFYCPHLPVISGPCACRKPARGMIDQALAAFDLDLARSFVVGDRLLDMELARNVSATGVMVLTGYGSVEVGDASDTNCPAEVVPDILAAVRWIVNHG